VHLIFVKFKIKPQHLDEFKTEMTRHVTYTKQHEPGCLQFDVAVDKEDPTIFYLVEVYKDDEAMTQHRASASLPIFRPKIEQWAEVREAKLGNMWPTIGK